MAIQRNKGVLEANIFPKGNQTLVVPKMPAPLRLVSRGEITDEVGVIETKDKRKMPGGRTNPGEFDAQVQLGDDEMRRAVLDWFEMSKDRGRGVNPNYKRDGILTYYRLFEGSPASEFAGAGRRGQAYKKKLLGLWISKATYPEFDMEGGHEGDADTYLNLTFQYDAVEAAGRN